MIEKFSRNELFWGNECQQKLLKTHVAVFGLGGVGGYCLEMLARSGVGKLSIMDFDVVSESNINRQVIANINTVGMKKTDLFIERLKSINPEIELNVVNDFFTNNFPFSDVDYVVDAIDTMRSKISLLEHCYKNKIPVVSSMGAGNRVNPEKLFVADLSDERIQGQKDVFCKNVVHQLSKLGILFGITFVSSLEKASVQERIREKEQVTTKEGELIEYEKIIPSSTPFVASTAGIMMASYIVRSICRL